jgi:hypothetical protein
MIEANVVLVDDDLMEYAELIKDQEYALMGKKPTDRVKKLLGKLHSATSSKNRGSSVSKEGNLLLSTRTQQHEEIFKNLPKQLK